MSDLVRRRLFGLAAVLVAISALAWISYGNLGQNLVYYWSPTELSQKGQAALGQTVRLGGLVVPGTFDMKKCDPGCDFRITDGKTEVAVRSDGLPPQMFREGQGVVVEGELEADGAFHTDRIMVKHSNEYRPPTDGQKPSAATLTDGAP